MGFVGLMGGFIVGWAGGIHSLVGWYLKGFTGWVGEIHIGLSVCKSHNLWQKNLMRSLRGGIEKATVFVSYLLAMDDYCLWHALSLGGQMPQTPFT